MNYQEKTIAEFEKETGWEKITDNHPTPVPLYISPVGEKSWDGGEYYKAYTEWLLSKMETMEGELNDMKIFVKNAGNIHVENESLRQALINKDGE